MTLTIPVQAARRFVLGNSGLWPGRRWRAPRGTEKAMRALEHVQLDPLQIMARAQDIALASRVEDYRPGDWEQVAYGKRRFFDWGQWLAARPMEELPLFRNVMRREAATYPGLVRIPKLYGAAIDEMRGLLADGHELSNRDFAANSRERVESYRGRKDSALALYYLWCSGEAMVTRRERFERVYAATERVAPPELLGDVPGDDETDVFLLNKFIAFHGGLSSLTRMGWCLGRNMPGPETKKWRAHLLDEGEVTEVRIEGMRAPHYVRTEDLPLLRTVANGRVPRPWKPLGPTTLDEVTFLSPLDPVSARGRAEQLFDFEYTWEVYVPEAKRRWGYYCLPILWGDELVGRFDGRLQRDTMTLEICALLLEDPALARNVEFTAALRLGMERYARFLGAVQVKPAARCHAALRKATSFRKLQ